MSFTLPEAFAKIPRHPLLYPTPSPIHPLPTLTSFLARHNNTTTNKPRITLFAKREDHSSPLSCAGNKYRKLEYIVPHILNPGPTPDSNKPQAKPTTIVTEGAIQSNHTVQVASVANKIGLEAVVVLHKGTGGGLSAANDKASFLRTGNVQINRLLGAEVVVLEPGSTAGGKDPIAEVIKGLERRGKVPYWIPSGASLHPLGGLGYARGAFEIAAQEREQLGEGGRFEYVFVACGSGSTVGGLIAGFKLLEKMEGAGRGPPRKVVGVVISPTKPREYHEGRVLTFARRAGLQIGLDPEQDITMDDVRLDDRFVGAAYGVLDTESKEALALLAQKEGVMVDPVYTSKVVRGMVHWVQKGDIVRDWSDGHSSDQPEGQRQVNALFIHTGGQSALGAYADIE